MKTSQVSLVLILAAVMASTLLLISPKTVKAGNDGWALINCYCGNGDDAFTVIGEATPKHNKIDKGNKMHWLVVGPTDATVELTFTPGDGCSGDDPFEPHDPLKVIITNKNHKFDDFPDPKIKSDATSGCYHYTITCTPKDAQAQSTTADPIIDVP